MEIQWRLRNKDWASCLRPWIPILLGLHLQFSRAASPPPPPPSCPDECRCDRTFVYCNERGLSSVPLGIGEGYKTLYLHNNRIANAGFPAELHRVASVETVYLYGNELDEFPLNLPRNVRVLHLQENNIQTVSRAALAQLARLEELHLDDNSVSTVGVEDGAFREAAALRLLFLTKNHLSSVPPGLPEDLTELRLDENRIGVVAEDAFRNVTRLERLLLDGNLLTDDGVAPGTFRDLTLLRELSMARNSLTYPPPLLPGEELAKLNFQENQMNRIPVEAFAGLHKLERLDLSNNQLQSLTRGVFDGLVSLRQLTVRNNLWLCDCDVAWVAAWLRSLPASLNVRGFMCQKPERVRGMVIRELSAELIQCAQQSTPAAPPGAPPTLPTPTRSGPTPAAGGDDSAPFSPSSSPDEPPVFSSPSSGLPSPPTGPPLHPVFPTRRGAPPRTKRPQSPPSRRGDALQVTFAILNGSAIHVSWAAAFPVTAYKVTWARMGPSLAGDTVRERVVGGEHRGVRLANLEPRSTYRICVIPLDAFNNYRPKDDTVCTEAVTTATTPVVAGGSSGDDNNNNKGPASSVPEQATQQDPTGSPFLLAGLIGGAVIVVLVVLLGVFCWHMHGKGAKARSSSASTSSKASGSSAKWKYARGRRKEDDYCEAGTKKDNSILEMTETSFQIVSLNNEQLLKGGGGGAGGDFRHIQPIYAPNGGGIGFRDCPMGGSDSAAATAYRKNNVRDGDLC